MIYIQKHSFRFRCGNGRRGSVIVLVVAVLALLAVIGTVYIVSARSERASANAGSTAENLDQAQIAVDAQVQRMIGDPMYGGDGTIAGTTSLGAFGTHAARHHDMPEINLLQGGTTFYNSSSPDESWLVTNLYRQNFGGAYYNDLTMPQSTVSDLSGTYSSPSVFDPVTGNFDLPAVVYVGGVPQLNNALYSGNIAGFFRVVVDPPPVTVPVPAGANNPALNDALVQMLPFSEGNGTRYRFGLRIIDTSRMANLNVGDSTAFNGNYNALFGTAASAGQPAGSARRFGTYYNGYLLTNPYNSGSYPIGTFNTSDFAGNLDATTAGFSNPGRYGAYLPTGDSNVWPSPTPPLDYVLQQLQFRAELPRVPAATVWDDKSTAPFDASDELALRSYGAAGDLSSSRPSFVWPNTLGSTAGFSRSFYTNYSYSRDLRTLADPTNPFTLTGMIPAFTSQTPSGIVVWPPYPARVNAMPDIAGYTKLPVFAACDELAMAATNIASAMKLVGYSDQEVCSFAANYLTFRWNSWTTLGSNPRTVSYKGNTVNVYSLPLGPSFIDSNGICIRADTLADSKVYGGVATDLHAETTGKVYMGFAAHPYINEIAASIKRDATDAKQTTDFAIELYNPFTVALSLDDYVLNVAGTDYSLQGRGWWVPPEGYFVLTQQNGDLSALITNADAQKQNDGAFTLSGAAIIYLRRRYTDRNGTAALAAVDQYDVSNVIGFMPASGDTSVHHVFAARDNVDDITAASLAVNLPLRWIATVHNAAFEAVHDDTGTAPNRLSLGSHNDNTASVAHVIPLYDRAIEHDSVANWDTRMPLDNIADFNRVMRISDQIDGSTGSPKDSGLVTTQFASLVGAGGNSDFPWDAQVHFDFRSIPRNYSSPPGPLPNPADYKPGDPGAVTLFDCLSLVDRVSDYTIDIGDNLTSTPNNTGVGSGPFFSRGLSKIRIPGQINVNTAPAEVLATIPILGQNPALIGTIMAYRYRIKTNDPQIPLFCQPSVVLDFSPSSPNAADFPGYGIRSLAELQVPLQVLVTSSPPSGSPPLSIYERDQLWADMCSSLTVRSDTFVVYAYLEAVRQNPRYTGAFDNKFIWYQNIPGASGSPGIALTDDPNDTAHPLLRVARRRWIMIVDRSQSNYSRYAPGSFVLDSRFSQPQIVAQKDLPR